MGIKIFEKIKHFKGKNYFIYGFFLLFLVFIFLLNISTPSYNPDMIFYVGSSVSINEKDPNLIHDITYKIIQNNIPQKNYQELTEKNEYLQIVFKNADAFNQQLPFYYVKPLYILLIYFLGFIGLNYVFATVLISAVSLSLVSFVIFLWVRKYISDFYGFFVTISIIACLSIIGLGRASVPDGLSLLVILISLFFYFERKNLLLFEILLVTSIFIRPDNIIFATFLFIYLGIWASDEFKLPKRHFLITLIIILLSYFSINKIVGAYDWNTLFYFSLIKYLPYPMSLTTSIFPDLYIKTVVLSLNSFSMLGWFTVMVLFFILFLSNIDYESFRKKRKINSDLSIILLITIIARFLLLPNFEDRYYSFYFVFSIILLIRVFKIENMKNI
jgi:hypothetical protein